MKVTLINPMDSDVAQRILIYTKQTRLTQGDDTRRKIAEMSPEQVAQELAYMATTIPSSWEFVDYVFEISGVSRAFTHQFVRTRTGSYAQQTMRMLPMEKFQFVVGPTIEADKDRLLLYKVAMAHTQHCYDQLIEMGASIEDARGILPTNICTNIIAKFNLRTLAEMARSRGGQRTQGEYREVLDKMIGCVLEVHPWAQPFLCPDKLDPVKKLEQLIKEYVHDNETRVLCYKQLDQIRKSL